MKNKKNMGFSLVELIVVIAIMAVLVGVLAPAYLQYVEKSRKSSDISALSEIMGAAEKVAIDPEFHLAAGDQFVITIEDGAAKLTMNYKPAGSDGGEEESGSGTGTSDLVLEAWQELASTTEYELKSSAFKAVEVTLTGEVTPAGGVKWTHNAKGANELIDFSSDFSAKFTKTE